MENKKKRTAAIAAVMSYIRTEEDMICMQGMTGEGIHEPPPNLKMWGSSARLAMMQTRNLMQMKTFHGTKLR